MSRSEFLHMSPREFDAMTERLNLKREDARYNTATVVAAIFNSVCDFEKRPEGFSPEDFLGSAGKSRKKRELEEFALECERNGYKWTPHAEDEEVAKDFVEQLEKTFNPAKLVRVKKE